MKQILEAILFATSEPMSLARLRIILKEYDLNAIQAALTELAETCDREGRAYSLEEIGGGFRFLTRPEYADYLRRLQKVASSERLSPAALETLAIIAYKQPVIKAEIDAIRGVKSEGTLQSLLRRHLIRVVGRAEVLGRPLLYGTTRLFLDQFGLKNLDELPSPEEVIQRMEEAEQASLEEAQVTQVDLEEPENRDERLLEETLPDPPSFRKERAEAEDGADPGAAGDPEPDDAGGANGAAPTSEAAAGDSAMVGVAGSVSPVSDESTEAGCAPDDPAAARASSPDDLSEGRSGPSVEESSLHSADSSDAPAARTGPDGGAPS